MPSHFHSPKKSFGSSAARSLSSIAWASIAGRKGTASRLVGLWPRPSRQAESSAEGGGRSGQISSTSGGSLSPSAAAAVFASRAETPIRKPPVTSLSSAQRPVSSSRSSQRASRPGNSDLPSEESAVTTEDNNNSSWPCEPSL